MKIIATVVYPITVEMESKEINFDILKDQIFDKAEEILTSTVIKPVITECNIEELID